MTFRDELYREKIKQKIAAANQATLNDPRLVPYTATDALVDELATTLMALRELGCDIAIRDVFTTAPPKMGNLETTLFVSTRFVRNDGGAYVQAVKNGHRSHMGAFAQAISLDNLGNYTLIHRHDINSFRWPDTAK